MADKPQLQYSSTQGKADPQKGNYSSSVVYQLIMQEARRRGYTWFNQNHALAMMGSFIQETGNFRKDVIDFDIRGDGGTAHGLMQWRGPRYKNLLNFANQNGMQPQDIRAQVSFAFEEGAANSPFADPGSVRAFKEFPQTKSVEDATVAFIHAERPAGYSSKNPGAAHDAQKRVSHAMKAGSAIEGVDINQEMQDYDFTSDGEYGNVNATNGPYKYGEDESYDADIEKTYGLPTATGNKTTNKVNTFVNNAASFADQVVGSGNRSFSYTSMFGVK